MRLAAPVPPDAVALTMFRALPDGRGRRYTVVTFPKDPHKGCERVIRMAAFVGWIEQPTQDSYAILDVLDANDDIIQDYGVTSPAAFQQIKRRLGLAVAEEDE